MVPEHNSETSERSFEHFAGRAATVVGLVGLLYSAAFGVYVLQGALWASYATAILLMVGGVATVVVLVALYGRLQGTNAPRALVALVLGVIGAMGSAVHGAYLAVLIHPLDAPTAAASAIDPRGFLTLAVAGLALMVIAPLLVRDPAFPRGLGYLGYISALLLEVIYLDRLLIFNPRNPVLLGAAALEGLVINPAWYLWLGAKLRRLPLGSESDRPQYPRLLAIGAPRPSFPAACKYCGTYSCH